MENPHNITRLLNDYSSGNRDVLNDILPVVYNELRRISSKYLREEYHNHTFQTTELVHEAFIRLTGNENLSWQNRAHFFGIAAQSMRQILVDHARKRNAKKRGGGAANISLDDVLEISENSDETILALDEALKKLESLEERISRIVELRFSEHGLQEENLLSVILNRKNIRMQKNY